MKLQLNEKTLNAYINEAIKQELAENSMGEAYRVDFNSLGEPTGPVKKGWGWNRLYTSPERARKAMGNGTYGRTGVLTPSALVSDLKALGYSEEQIQNGIRTGAIKIGKNFGKGQAQQFLPHNNLRKQNRRDARLRTAAGMPVADYDKQQSVSGETQNEKFPWDDTEPAWTPRKPKSSTPASTAPTQSEPKPSTPTAPIQGEPEPTQPVRPALGSLAPVTMNVPTGATTTQTPGIIGRKTEPSIAQKAVQTMAQTTNQNTMGLKDRIKTNNQTAQQARKDINQAVRNGEMSKGQAKNDKKLIRGANRTLKTGQPMSE